MQYTPSDTHVLIRCASHRSRTRLQALSPERFPSYYSWDTACTGGFVLIPVELLPAALAITGCSRASLRFAFYPCR